MRTGAAALAIALAVVATGARAELIEVVPGPTTARGSATLTLLPGGRALLSGGAYLSTAAHLSTAEIFDFKSKTWSPAASMSRPRAAHGAARLRDGRVLVVGGLGTSGGSTLKSAEIYDPATDKWSTIAPPNFEHADPLAVGADGRVGALGGSNPVDTARNQFEIYDPLANTWTPRAGSLHQRMAHGLAALSGGYLAVGGSDTSVLERYDAAKNSWLALPSLAEARTSPAVVTLADGRVLIVGGGRDPMGALPVVFDPASNTVSPTLGAPDRRTLRAAAVVLPDGRVLMLGASAIERSSGVPMTVDVFDPATDKSSALANLALGPLVAAANADHVLAVTDGGAAYLLNVPRRCTGASDCDGGFCADGYCCNSACTGQCEACDVAGNTGRCSPVDGKPHGDRKECAPPWTPPCHATTCEGARDRNACVAPTVKPVCSCSRDSDCDNGHCADGVCCNTACDGQCEACDMPGARGTCIPVTGEPRGIRKGCAVPGLGICTVQACNGKDPKQCLYMKAETPCDSICGGRVQRHCDGQGACGLPNELKCPNNSCSTASPEPTERPRFLDALLVVGLGALVARYRRRTKEKN